MVLELIWEFVYVVLELIWEFGGTFVGIWWYFLMLIINTLNLFLGISWYFRGNLMGI